MTTTVETFETFGTLEIEATELEYAVKRLENNPDATVFVTIDAGDLPEFVSQKLSAVVGMLRKVGGELGGYQDGGSVRTRLDNHLTEHYSRRETKVFANLTNRRPTEAEYEAAGDDDVQFPLHLEIIVQSQATPR